MDTNAVIEFLGGHLPASAMTRIQEIVEDEEHALSVVNHIELMAYNGTVQEMQTMQDFIDASTVIPLTDPIVNKTIDLRKLYKKKLPDTIIAATAFVHNLTILTRNESDFRRMTGLNVTNPHNI